MIDVEFDIQMDDSAAPDDALMDEFELQMLLEHTYAQLEEHIQRSLGDLRCAEHGQQPKVRIVGTYSLETEQLDFSYDLDTCCQTLLAQAIAALNRR